MSDAQWHLGGARLANLPHHRGFDRYYGFAYAGGQDYWDHFDHSQRTLDLHDTVRETPFLRHFILKMIILPRQAWDKHRKNSPKELRLLIASQRT
jgi:hypothetical protein